MQLLLNKYWTLFSSDKPKGFGKFFGERSSKPPPKVDNENSSRKVDNEDSSKRSESSDTGRDTDKSKKPENPFKFEFKLNVGGDRDSGGRKSGGKGNSEREKWFTFGMIGSAIAIATMSYYGYSYQEISWKELTG